MARRQRSLWEELQRMQDEMDAMLENFLPDTRRRAVKLWRNAPVGEQMGDYRRPLTDVAETDESYVVTVELPGVNKEDIDVEIVEGGLKIQVESSQSMEEKEEGTHQFERSYQGFYRYLSLPQDANPEQIRGTYNNGVLELHIGRKQKKKQGKKIKIQ